jgi:hypothetical protein
MKVRLKIELETLGECNTPLVNAYALTLRGERHLFMGQAGGLTPMMPSMIVEVDEHTHIVLKLDGAVFQPEKE